MATYPPLTERPLKDTIVLFDVDDTLTKPRQSAAPEMLQTLAKLRQQCAIGFVGGSNLVKQQEQLGTASVAVTSMFDFCFAENGLIAYRQGEPLDANSFIKWLGEAKYQKLAKFILRYISELDGLPAMRGTFIEFRNGMINVSPVGRNATQAEREQFCEWDKTSKCREKMVAALRTEFADLGLTFSIGGQISFDVFPKGWDKTYCLNHLAAEEARSGIQYKKIHFFGDKCFPGGNDYEIYSDPRTIGHAVAGPEDTLKQLKETFGL